MTTFKELQSFFKAQTAQDPWAIAWAIVNAGEESGENSVNPLYTKEAKAAAGDTEKRKALAAKIAAGIGENPFNKSADIQKISPATAALAGWWLGGTIRDDFGRMSQPTASQQREFERQIQQAMRKKGRQITKESAMEKMQSFFQKDDNDTYVRKTPVKNAVEPQDEILEKVLSFPPFAGARLDPTSHRWVKPENFGQTYNARGGKKRVRASGTGAHERSVSGHGKGRIRGEGAGAKGKGETHLASQRRKEGFTHGKQQGKKKS
tara:strand:- start:3592 stop:4383 length:792 start_codon:yes stop_codon:yes gene_type:complete